MNIIGDIILNLRVVDVNGTKILANLTDTYKDYQTGGSGQSDNMPESSLPIIHEVSNTVSPVSSYTFHSSNRWTYSN